MDLDKRTGLKNFFQETGWLDKSGRLIPEKEHEVARIYDESPEFYTNAYRAFNQDRNMAPRRQRSMHALQGTPPEMQKVGIELRPAQLEGAGLLCWLENLYGLAILADDMGVGKAFQLIALMFCNQPRDAVKTTLLVVPAGAITMWKANLKMFPDLSCIEYNTYNKDEVDVKDLVMYDVVLSTYNLIAKQHSQYAERVLDIKAAVQVKTSRSIGSNPGFEKPLDIQRPWAPFYGMEFHRVILDEAHRIRNMRSGQFKAMLKLNTKRRIACSGTIFNNDYTDVGAILTFLRYQLWCNPSSFSRYFLKGGKKRSGGARKRAQLKYLRGAGFKYILDGISVRRNKKEKFEGKEIIDFEQLDYQISEHSLDDRVGSIMIEYRLYTEQDAQNRTKELWSRQRSSEDDEYDADEEPMDEDKTGLIRFARLAYISNLCPEAGYSNRGLESEMELDIKRDRYDNYSHERNIEPVRTDVSAFEEARDKVRKAARTEWAKSTKLREAFSHIKEHLEQSVDLVDPAKPHKIVVHCEYLSALHILEVGIQEEIPGQPVLRIDGQSSTKSRNKAIDLFMQDPEHCIITITVHAGSEAIDLSSADYILLLHPVRNPAQIQRYIGRAYRYGQERQVKARVLVAKSSIEGYIYKIQDHKRKKDLLLQDSVERKDDGEGCLKKIRVGKVYDRTLAGISEAIQDPNLDGNDAPQSEAEMMGGAGQVLPGNNSSSDAEDSGDDSDMIETEVIED